MPAKSNQRVHHKRALPRSIAVNHPVETPALTKPALTVSRLSDESKVREQFDWTIEIAMADMEAVSFGGCFGWLHQGGGGALGVVLCGSWEYEALATHQSWRVLADRLAEAGLSTLRFDYLGAGDSAGRQPGAWRAGRSRRLDQSRGRLLAPKRRG